MRSFGWAIVIFVLLEGVAILFAAWATVFCLLPKSRTLSILNLWKITLVERGISYLTPTAGVGGDIVKWSVFERYLPPTEAASTVMIYRLAHFLSKLLFCLVGAVPILMIVPLSAKLKLPLFIGTTLLGAGLIGFLVYQKKGLFTSSLDGTVGRFLGSRTREKVRNLTLSFDEHLRVYHREHSRDFWYANLILWLGFAVGGVLQAWLFAVIVLKESSPAVAVVIWILGSWSDMVFFFVPAGIGTKEFARVLIFDALNFAPATGASFALILRIEELFWAGVGLLLYVLMVPKHERRRGATHPQDMF